MTKITFKDLPDTSTPLNASNLNTMQDNIEDAIPTLDNAVSTSSTNGVENQAITNYVNNRSPLIDIGETDTVTTVNGYVDKTITFTKPFTQPPKLFLSLDGFSTNTNYEHVTLMFDNVTTTGAKIRILSSFANLYPKISWVAIGI